MITEELVNTFNKYFIVEFVNTDKQREDMYRLRYQTYIEEFGFDDPRKYPDKLEKDEYDDISSACIIYHIPSGKPAACVRVIPGYDCSKLPVEKYIGHSINKEILDDLNTDRTILSEISRLAVSKDFRRREREKLTPVGFNRLIDERDDNRTFPLLSIACFISCIVLSDIINTEHNIASMEPFLPRLIQRSGIHFEKIGSVVNYHGARGSYLIHKSNVIQSLTTSNIKLWTDIQHGILNQIFHVF